MHHSQILSEAIRKLEHYCAYQERCHDETIAKMRSLSLSSTEIDTIMVHLIEGNFINEERFAQSFARGKHRIKLWGKVRIVNELKFRNISQVNIRTALKEISEEEYSDTFERLSARQWESLPGKDTLSKRKKFCDFLLRKGYESDLVYARAKELESTKKN